MRTETLSFRVIAVVVGLVVVGALGWVVLRPAGGIAVTSYFREAVGVYEGSSVRILGVDVGEITEVVPEGDRVRIEMTIDADIQIPATARAAIVAPSLVSDRYVQFFPAYISGPTMADKAEIPLSRTATPVELDEIYSTLNELNIALGPNGANATGALSDLIDVGAANLEGNGAALNATLVNFSEAIQTLSTGRDDLFGSLDNLAVFTTALAESDAQVRAFNDNLASVSTQLAGESADLARALSSLTLALSDVAAFVEQNTEALAYNVNGLAQVTLVLAQQRDALASFLGAAPVAVGNLSNAYNANSGTLDTRNNFAQLTAPALQAALCGILVDQLDQLGISDLLAPITGDPSLEQQRQNCLGVFSGDLDGDGVVDDANGDLIPDVQTLIDELFGIGSAPSNLLGTGSGDGATPAHTGTSGGLLPGLSFLPGLGGGVGDAG
ncbi:MAG: MCE family protein [Actinomycetota bacterium]|nr:MCE family protein [Actinomycetota bacterium]